MSGQWGADLPSFSETLEAAIHQALAEANTRKHKLATLEHLLLTLLDEPDAQKVMRACAVDIEDLRDVLLEFVDIDLVSLISDLPNNEAAPTAAFQRVIQRAAIRVQSTGRTEVTGSEVLVAIFAERESNAAYFLQEQDITRYDAVNFIAHGVAKDPAYNELDPESEPQEERLTEAEWRAREEAARAAEPACGGDAGARDDAAPGPVPSGNAPTAAIRVATADPEVSFVFLSYAHQDREAIAAHYGLLREQALDLWWDQDIQPGDSWRDRIADHLEQATVILTFWTQHSTASKAVTEEAARAQAARKLVHVRLDDAPVPYGFGETQYVDLRDWDGMASHPDYQRLISALRDKLARPTLEFASRRVAQSSPIEMVADDGRLTLKDAPVHVPPPLVDPADLAARIEGLHQSVCTMIGMCSDRNSFQLPGTLDHCLEAVRLAVTTDPVTWYALEDAKCLLSNCLQDSFAAETWNAVVYTGVAGLVTRIDEIKPLLLPRQIDPQTEEPKPVAPEPTVRADEVAEVLRLASDLRGAFASEEGAAVLNDNVRQSLEQTVEAVEEAGQSDVPVDRKLHRFRRAVKGLAYLTGGLMTAIGTGVVVNLLTSPTAAVTLSTRLKPIFDALLQFFL